MRERRPAERGARPRREAARDDEPLDGRGRSVSLNAAANPVLDELEALGDDEGLAAVLLHLGHVNQDRYEQASAYLERAMAVAERAGDRRRGASQPGSWGPSWSSGPCPPPKGSSVAVPCADSSPTRPAPRPSLLRHEAVLHAMQGRIDEARTLHAEAVRAIDELGIPWLSASTVFGQWCSRCWPERPSAPRPRPGRASRSCRRWAPPTRARPPPRCWPTRSSQQGRHDEALRYADLAAAWAAPDDTSSQVPQLAARAHVLAARGELERAEAAAREAVRVSERSDEHRPTRRRAHRSRRRAGPRRPPRRGGRGAPRRHQPLRAQGQHRLRSPHTPDARQPRTQGARHEDVASPMHRHRGVRPTGACQTLSCCGE